MIASVGGDSPAATCRRWRGSKRPERPSRWCGLRVPLKGLLSMPDSTADKARTFFESIWQKGDYWELDTAGYERERYSAIIAALRGHQYERVLEIGCGAGAFTELLLPLADRLSGIDVAPTAVERAAK